MISCQNHHITHTDAWHLIEVLLDFLLPCNHDPDLLSSLDVAHFDFDPVCHGQFSFLPGQTPYDSHIIRKYSRRPIPQGIKQTQNKYSTTNDTQRERRKDRERQERERGREKIVHQ